MPDHDSSLTRTSSSNTHSSFLNAIYLDPRTRQSRSHEVLPITTNRISTRRGTESVATQIEHRRQLSLSDGDIDDDDDDYEDLVGSEVRVVTGGTKPLRVRKKKGVVLTSSAGSYVRVNASKARRRRSTLSFPHSPSPRTPLSPRHFGSSSLSRAPSAMPQRNASVMPHRNPSVTSNTSSTHPHAAISRLFLSLPEAEPSPSPKQSAHLQMNRSSSSQNMYPSERTKIERVVCHEGKRDRTSGSSLHLGLGRFGSYDPVIPGPSPPSSPLPSPTKRAFIASQYARRPLPAPPSPLTPSRAPRKAAQLLGAGHTASAGSGNNGFSAASGKNKSRKNVNGALNGKHFRPLPHSALLEIERFFGEVPKKPSKPPILKSSLLTDGSRSRSKSTSHVASGNGHGSVGKMDERGNGDRGVGEGKTVKHQGEDGSMWMDVEEEQEFAWLMSEIFAIAPQPLPVLDLSRVGSNSSGKEITTASTRSEDLRGEDAEEGKWEMETFTSVLSLPKPKKTTSTQRAKDSAKKNAGFSRRGGGRRREGSEDSFLNLDLDTPLPVHGKNRSFGLKGSKGSTSSGEGDSNGGNPWSVSLKHTRSHSNPTPTSASFEPSPSPSSAPTRKISLPTPALLPPPRISSRNADANANGNPSPGFLFPFSASSQSLSTSGSGSDSELSSSPPRIKNRPPPLTLPKLEPSSKLPILTATSPSEAGKTAASTVVVGAMGMTRSHTSPPSIDQRTQVKQARPAVGVSEKVISVPMTTYEQPPSTPFVRPRIAPRPQPGQAQHQSDIPPIPSLPASLSTTAYSTPSREGDQRVRFNGLPDRANIKPQPRNETARKSSGLSLSQMMSEEPMSFFEPVTPVEAHSYLFDGNGSGKNKTGTPAVENGGTGGKKGWLKRVVRNPLAGRI